MTEFSEYVEANATSVQLSSIDLFSGIAGFTLATSFATPLLYCDNSPTVRSTLSTLFKKKALPEAPTVEMCVIWTP